MPTLAPTARRPAAAAPSLRRAAAIGGCCAGALAGAWLGTQAPPWHAESGLTLLLRGMAAIKAAMLLAALAVVVWRLGGPLPRGHAAAFIAALTVAACAVALIAQPAFVGAAAVAFHAAEALFLVIAWREWRRGGRP